MYLYISIEMDLNKTTNCELCHRKSSCFSNIETTELINLDSSRVELKFKKGEIICKQRSFASQINYLYSGLVKTYLEIDDGKDLIASIVTPGHLIGLPSLYSDKTCQYSAMALQDCVICSIDIQVFDKYIKTNGNFASEIIYELNKNTSIGYARLISLTHKNLHGRIADSLLYLAQDVYKSDSFPMVLTRKDFAELSGTTSESITRVFSKLNSEGVIRSENNQMELIDKAKLIQISRLG